MGKRIVDKNQGVEQTDMALVHRVPPFDDHDKAQARKIVNWFKRMKDRERLAAGDKTVVARVERRRQSIKEKRAVVSVEKKIKQAEKASKRTTRKKA
jgi:hypothetical protein